MARTWSARLGWLYLHAGAVKVALQARFDRAFLGAAVLAHLCISILGASTLLEQASQARRALPVLLEPSVLLFLAAGGCTAVLLLRMSRALPRHQPHAADEMPAHSQPAAPLPLRDPAFSGLLDSVGHELRTPLNAIIGFSELMQRETLGPLGSPRYQDYARHIRDSGLAVLRAAEDTMALTALLADRGRPLSETVDLDAILDEACRASGADACGVPVLRSVPCGAVVRAEPAALRQSLTGLVAAAVRRTPMGHRVSITTHIAAGTVRLCLAFPAMPDTDARETTRSSVAVARMLFDLQGMTLTERKGRDGVWRMTVAMPLVAAPHPAAVGTMPPLPLAA